MKSIKNVILTRREEEIIAELAQGLYYKEIARKTSISTETVKKHCQNIYRKLGVRNRMEATSKYKYTSIFQQSNYSGPSF